MKESMTSPTYQVKQIARPFDVTDLNASAWSQAELAHVGYFHPASSSHHPRTVVRLLHDGEAMYIRFDVDDQFVVARATANQQQVCLHSCVEFFVQPRPDAGYFNFEFNCGGTVLAYYVEDPTRTPDGLAKATELKPEELAQLTIVHTLPRQIEPERTEPTSWQLMGRIPLSLLRRYLGRHPLENRHWRANFYKCADQSSHPHWASWAPLGEALNFHQPARFGDLLL